MTHHHIPRIISHHHCPVAVVSSLHPDVDWVVVCCIVILCLVVFACLVVALMLVVSSLISIMVFHCRYVDPVYYP